MDSSSGTLSAWTNAATDNGNLSVHTHSAIIGEQGLQAVIDDNNLIYVSDYSPVEEARYHARFYFDPNSILMGNDNNYYLLYGLKRDGSSIIRLELQYASGSYQLRASVAPDDNNWRYSNWINLSDTPHAIEFDWMASTAPGANSGMFKFWVDGVSQYETTGIDNDTHRIQAVQLGILGSVETETRGTVNFDGFVSRRGTEIGLDPEARTSQIFSDGFESIDFSAWSSSVTDGDDLMPGTWASIVADRGMVATIDDNTSIYVVDERPHAETRYRARFYFDPNAIYMSSSDTFTAFQGYMSPNTPVVRVEVRSAAGDYQIRTAALNDNQTWQTTPWLDITDGPHAVELEWKKATYAGVDNGALNFWLDGEVQSDLSNVDNDTYYIETIRLGVIDPNITNTSGSVFFDAFDSKDGCLYWLGPLSAHASLPTGKTRSDFQGRL